MTELANYKKIELFCQLEIFACISIGLPCVSKTDKKAIRLITASLKGYKCRKSNFSGLSIF